MTAERLTALVAELDALVPQDGAVILEDHGLYGSEHDPAYVGNPRGYRRLGIEFLKLADAPSDPRNPNRVLVDLSYLVNVDRHPGEVAIFERRELAPSELVAPRAQPGLFRRVLAGLAVLLAIGLLVLGFIDVVAWLIQRFAT